LPGYCVRVSARARHVRLVMRPGGLLEVVIPRGFDAAEIPDLIEKKRTWITRVAAREVERDGFEGGHALRLPEAIDLAALRETWRVEYVLRPARGTTAREHPSHLLVVSGAVGDLCGCREALRRWLTRRARRTLLPRLAVLGAQGGFRYARASIRQQRTRWGSCSRTGVISLNARLLFLPAEVVDYVLIHELCHTVEMSHSPSFWGLVEAHDPAYRGHRREIRAAARALPAWLDASGPPQLSEVPLDDL
jgi:predicted metal-dependent hydrolase